MNHFLRKARQAFYLFTRWDFDLLALCHIMWPGQWVAVSAMGPSKVKPFDDGHGGVSTSALIDCGSSTEPPLPGPPSDRFWPFCMIEPQSVSVVLAQTDLVTEGSSVRPSLSVKVLEPKRRDWRGPWYKPDKSRFSPWEEYLLDLAGVVTFPQGPSSTPLMRLAAKVEPAGNTRVFTIVDSLSQRLLRPIHDWLCDVLRRSRMVLLTSCVL